MFLNEIFFSTLRYLYINSVVAAVNCIENKKRKIETKLFFKERERTHHIVNEIFPPPPLPPTDLLKVISLIIFTELE